MLVTIFLGIALAFFTISLLPGARRAIEQYRARSGMAAVDDWQPLIGTERVEGPTLEILDDWSGRITTRYEGEEPIEQDEIAIYCQLLSIPVTWTLETCAVDPGNPNSYTIVLVR
jgi:hypothetical protein